MALRAVFKPALTDLDTVGKAVAIRGYIENTGIAPEDGLRTLAALTATGDPASRIEAARHLTASVGLALAAMTSQVWKGQIMNFGTGDAVPVEAPADSAPRDDNAGQGAVEAPEAQPDSAPEGTAFAEDVFGRELKSVYAQSDPEQSLAELQAEFGPNYDSYRQMASGFTRIDGFQEAQHVLEVAGVVNHPAIMRFLMNAGRVHYRSAEEPDKAATADRPGPDDDELDDTLEALRARQQDARANGHGRKADELYRRELTLIAQRQGDDAIVNGRRTA